MKKWSLRFALILLAMACGGSIVVTLLHISRGDTTSPTSSGRNQNAEAISSRPATPAERRAILAVDRTYLGLTRATSRCIDYEIAVSKPGAEYAMVAYGFHLRRKGCAGVAFNGQTLFKRIDGKWKFRAAASEWNCSVAPKGFLKSLTIDPGAYCIQTK
ncbi:MAG: hypothetical protein ACYDHO_01145 [Gaiellaceae bacterium]